MTIHTETRSLVSTGVETGSSSAPTRRTADASAAQTVRVFVAFAAAGAFYAIGMAPLVQAFAHVVG